MDKLYNGLPLFEITIDEDGELQNISIVDEPAIEMNFLAFSKEEEVRLSVDDEKHIVSGPALIPDMPIYRRDERGRGYYITFSKQAIEDIAIRFFEDHNNTNGNLMHQVDVDGVTYFESYIVNRDRGIVPVEFEDVPNGTWMVSAKIHNEEVWNLIKNGTLRGFSISGNLTFTRAKEDKEIDSIEDLLSYLKNNNKQ